MESHKCFTCMWVEATYSFGFQSKLGVGGV